MASKVEPELPWLTSWNWITVEYPHVLQSRPKELIQAWSLNCALGIPPLHSSQLFFFHTFARLWLSSFGKSIQPLWADALLWWRGGSWKCIRHEIHYQNVSSSACRAETSSRYIVSNPSIRAWSNLPAMISHRMESNIHLQPHIHPPAYHQQYRIQGDWAQKPFLVETRPPMYGNLLVSTLDTQFWIFAPVGHFSVRFVGIVVGIEGWVGMFLLEHVENWECSHEVSLLIRFGIQIQS